MGHISIETHSLFQNLCVPIKICMMCSASSLTWSTSPVTRLQSYPKTSTNPTIHKPCGFQDFKHMAVKEPEIDFKKLIQDKKILDSVVKCAWVQYVFSVRKH